MKDNKAEQIGKNLQELYNELEYLCTVAMVDTRSAEYQDLNRRIELLEIEKNKNMKNFISKK
tara:strand:+ start:255 stop:440 length:186 start_codon:yes stop_codon:yes gene_type:complete